MHTRWLVTTQEYKRNVIIVGRNERSENMNIFDEVDENLFRPLTGINKRKYVDILTLIWDKCKRMPMYAIEKSTTFDMVEDYFYGLDEQVELDLEEQAETDGNIADTRVIAGGFIRRLKETGWLTEKEGEYEEESKLAINYKVVPLLKSFQEIISPTIITYKGKLFKIYSMFEHISEQGSPYEGVLKEASEDFDNLNQALRILSASIEDHINNLTQGKKPEEVLEFFEKYEEKIVVGSYHRFKTNDNLFYYRTSLYESLDKCEGALMDALVTDYMDAERVDKAEATVKIKELITKVRMDIEEMEAIMRTIDDRHIIYRTRAVQRAQFLLLSDGSVKSKINNMLQYYASQIKTKEDLYEDDETVCQNVFQIFGQNFFDSASLATPVKKRCSSPIELMSVIDELDMELVEEKNRKMMDYIRNALTSENVNSFAKDILQGKTAISISTKKVSINLLSDKNVESYEVNGDTILVIYVPRAKREQKPVYINNDLFGGCYRRDWEGDYHCSKAEIKGMLRDAADETEDMKIVEQFDISAIDTESLKGFRNHHKSYRPEHVFNNLPDEEYLERIGAAGYGEDGKLHPTTAGLLMFGEEYHIVREFLEYFLDYREMLDPTIRWTDRLQSSSGDWSGNVFDFFFRVNNKIAKDIKKPFKLEGITRIDDTPVHKAVREALVNCLVNTDYFLPCGVVIKKEDDKLVIENPGSIRTGKKQMLRGGISDPRNKTLMKMFNMIGIGERAGSGIPDIYQVWENEGWPMPVVEESYNPDRTRLSLEFSKKQAIKTSDKNKR